MPFFVTYLLRYCSYDARLFVGNNSLRIVERIYENAWKSRLRRDAWSATINQQLVIISKIEGAAAKNASGVRWLARKPS